MAKFCPNCGSQLENDSLFCASCGTRVEIEPQPQPTYTPAGGVNTPPTPPTPVNKLKSKLTKKHLVLGGSILAGIIVVILALALLFPGPKAVAKKYVKGYLNGNAKQVVSCAPSFFYEDKDEKNEAIENLEEIFEDMELDEFDKIKYEIKDVTKLSRDEREQLESMLEMYERYYDDFDADSINVKKAKKVEVKITVKDGGDTHRETFEIILVKYKGQWKVLYSDLDLY